MSPRSSFELGHCDGTDAREHGAARVREALELALLAARGELDELRLAQDDTLGRVTVLEAALRAAERDEAVLRRTLADVERQRDEARARLTRRNGTFQH